MDLLSYFSAIWVIDFEFFSKDGNPPYPVCVVAKEITNQRELTLWLVEERPSQAPYSLDEKTLLVTYFGSAEMGCHLQLKWSFPVYHLDLYTEFRTLTNGISLVHGAGLLGALAYFGLPSMANTEKEANRGLVLKGPPWTPEERRAILIYCRDDVIATERLFRRMIPFLDLPRALVRGHYMNAVAQMEQYGVPIDTNTLARLKKHWHRLKLLMIDKVDKDFGFFEKGSFKHDYFGAWLASRGIVWPVTQTGRLCLDDDTFKQMVLRYPKLRPIRDLRQILGKLNLNNLAVGEDDRNRTLLSPFLSKTGRNQPSNSRFIFGPSVWMRSLIQPSEGYAIAYLDYEQQEFGIGAALSNDPAMKEAYQSGDPYLAFAIQASAVPPTATKESHPQERDLFKQCVLAVQYGMTAHGLAKKIGQPPAYAQHLLNLHTTIYHIYWKWSDAVVEYAFLHNELFTTFGWHYHVTGLTKGRTLRNFPMQANGAEILRLACCLALQAGVKVCAPVHDALLIEAPQERIDAAVSECTAAMIDASRIVLKGFELRVEAKVFTSPQRFSDPRGEKTWNDLMDLLDECDREEEGCNMHQSEVYGAPFSGACCTTRPISSDLLYGDI
jgi:hypothetical protein